MSKPNRDNPIFVVGAPRSGTTLLAAMLSAHSNIACGPETNFFWHLTSRGISGVCDDPAWPVNAVAMIMELELVGQNVVRLFESDEREIRTFLESRTPNVRSMLESLTLQFARKKGKKRWAEKTPGNLRYLSTIRAQFPDAQIIRIVRDPRDSALSMSKLPWGHRSVLANCDVLNDWHGDSRVFFESDEISLTLKYESLAYSPEVELRRVCDFIGERFEPEMLNTSHSGQDLITHAEPWKNQVSMPIDTSRVFPWRKELSRDLQLASTVLCYDAISEFGYDNLGISLKSQAVYAFHRPKEMVEPYKEELLLRCAIRGARLVPAKHPMMREPVLFLKPRFSGSIKADYPIVRAYVARVFMRRLVGRQVFVLGNSLRGAQSVLEWILVKTLSLFGSDW